ncbi:MAG TPA: hypothetical protein VH482_28225 [Thermomicrobiales bacterium]|jgi:hypothetical protein
MWPFRRKPKPTSLFAMSDRDAEREMAPREAVRRTTQPTLDRHFALQEEIQAAYRRRDRDPKALAAAIAACKRQIALAPATADAMRTAWRDDKGTPLPLPRHVGFEQLAIVREREGDLAGAIRLAQEAQRQGWAGEWERRVSRCEAKLAKRGTDTKSQ